MLFQIYGFTFPKYFSRIYIDLIMKCFCKDTAYIQYSEKKEVILRYFHYTPQVLMDLIQNKAAGDSLPGLRQFRWQGFSRRPG